jgi:hypothetical protein
MSKSPFESIDPSKLEAVAGGAARASSSGSSDITAAITAIQSSIKDLASNQNTGMDPMMMIMMMMMMGGGGGGGGYMPAAAAVGTPPVINVDTGVSGGGGCGGGCARRGKKGW